MCGDQWFEPAFGVSQCLASLQLDLLQSSVQLLLSPQDGNLLAYRICNAAVAAE